MQLYIIYASTRTKQHSTHKKPSNTRATKYPSKKTATTPRFNECIFYFSISISQPAQPTSFRSPQLKGLGKDKISRRKRKVIASCFVINSRECAPQKKRDPARAREFYIRRGNFMVRRRHRGRYFILHRVTIPLYCPGCYAPCRCPYRSHYYSS